MRATISNVLTVLVVWMLAAGAASMNAQSDTAEVQTLTNAYAAAWAKADAKSIAAMFEPEGVAVGGFGDVSTGRAQIEQNLVKLFAGAFKGTKIRVVTEGTRQVGADTLVTVGSYEIAGVTGANGQQTTLRGRYVNTLVRRDGKLLVAANAANIPPQAQGNR